uniref:ubiquitinyl hydrolase 1 n=1 Tax=Ascaris lumbricoides TaxID=6252 RepID=A0A9J2PY54_ASCLU
MEPSSIEWSGFTAGRTRLVPGWVEWIGEPFPREGTKFGIRLESAIGDMDGTYKGRRLFSAPHNGAVLVTGDLLRRPFPTNAASVPDSYYSVTNASDIAYGDASIQSAKIPSVRMNRSTTYDEDFGAPVVRNVPIRIVSSPRHNEPPPYASVFPKSATSSEESLPSYNTRPTSQRSSLHCTQREGTNGLVCAVRAGPSPTQRPPKVPVVESSSNTASELNLGHTSGVSNSTVSMPHCCALSNGDRIVWFDRIGVPRHGTVRWIGRLKGHSNIYVGVDFDEEIGGGTGRYQGIELFRAALNHAGLLPLCVCMKESDMDVSPTERKNDSSISVIPPIRLQSLSEHSAIRNDDSALKCCESDSSDSNDLRHSPFTVGSCVEVDFRNERRFGVVKSIGYVHDENTCSNDKSATVEIEGLKPRDWPSAQEVNLTVTSPPGSVYRATGPVAVVPVSSLRQDNRFATPIVSESPSLNADLCVSGAKFGSLDGGVELNACPPARNVESLIGRMKGIQGFRNSCYLDATLYAMFVQSTAFDSILEPREALEDSCRQEVVRILATEIVYPLRKFHFVRADHVYKLRQLLEQLLPEMPGLTSDEKDPEEVLIALFDKVLKVEPFLLLRDVTEGTIDPVYICPLITEDLWSGEQRHLITVQSIVERSLFASNVQFAKDPKVLILQLPRYGQQKVFDKIIPQQELDITHLVFDSKRPCTICGKAADLICPECFLTKEVLLGEVTYCGGCYDKAHMGFDHRSQSIRRLSQKETNSSLSRRSQAIAQRKLQLMAVLCIEMSHYVTFVRAINANKWLMFDSMADRVGLSDGYNVPEVKHCEKMAQWLTESGVSKLRSFIEKERRLPSEVETDSQLMRLLSDCYVCIYTNDEQKERKLDAITLAARLFA